jgi:TolB-like protein
LTDPCYSPTPPAPISAKSVAILPFLDMSENKDQEHFSDGLTEELINRLSKIPDMRVPARTSSFYFKGKSEDIPTIAKKLMVAHSVAERRLPVCVRLNSCRSDRHRPFCFRI